MIFATGNTSISFGAWPGLSHTTATVSGIQGLQTGMRVVASIVRRATVESDGTTSHTEDEASLEKLRCSAGDIVADSGSGGSFTVHCVYDGAQMDPGPGGVQPMASGVYSIVWTVYA